MKSSGSSGKAAPSKWNCIVISGKKGTSAGALEPSFAAPTAGATAANTKRYFTTSTAAAVGRRHASAAPAEAQVRGEEESEEHPWLTQHPELFLASQEVEEVPQVLQEGLNSEVQPNPELFNAVLRSALPAKRRLADDARAMNPSPQSGAVPLLSLPSGGAWLRQRLDQLNEDRPAAGDLEVSNTTNLEQLLEEFHKYPAPEALPSLLIALDGCREEAASGAKGGYYWTGIMEGLTQRWVSLYPHRAEAALAYMEYQRASGHASDVAYKALCEGIKQAEGRNKRIGRQLRQRLSDPHDHSLRDPVHHCKKAWKLSLKGHNGAAKKHRELAMAAIDNAWISYYLTGNPRHADSALSALAHCLLPEQGSGEMRPNQLMRLITNERSRETMNSIAWHAMASLLANCKRHAAVRAWLDATVEEPTSATPHHSAARLIHQIITAIDSQQQQGTASGADLSAPMKYESLQDIPRTPSKQLHAILQWASDAQERGAAVIGRCPVVPQFSIFPPTLHTVLGTYCGHPMRGHLPSTVFAREGLHTVIAAADAVKGGEGAGLEAARSDAELGEDAEGGPVPSTVLLLDALLPDHLTPGGLGTLKAIGFSVATTSVEEGGPCAWQNGIPQLSTAFDFERFGALADAFWYITQQELLALRSNPAEWNKAVTAVTAMCDVINMNSSLFRAVPVLTLMAARTFAAAALLECPHAAVDRLPSHLPGGWEAWKNRLRDTARSMHDCEEPPALDTSNLEVLNLAAEHWFNFAADHAAALASPHGALQRAVTAQRDPILRVRANVQAPQAHSAGAADVEAVKARYFSAEEVLRDRDCFRNAMAKHSSVTLQAEEAQDFPGQEEKAKLLLAMQPFLKEETEGIE